MKVYAIPFFVFFLSGCVSTSNDTPDARTVSNTGQSSTQPVSRDDLYQAPKQKKLQERIWATEAGTDSKAMQNKNDVDVRHLKSKYKERNEPYKMGDIKAIPNMPNSYDVDPSKR
ncbi:MAG: hypothetical protein ACTHJ4_04700 [Candidatus Nucleicultricaceae bacterium]